MISSRLVLSSVLLLLASQLVSPAWAEGPTKQLLDLSGDFQKHLTPQFGSNDQVSAAVSKDPAAPGLVITIQPGKADYPGINLKPEGKAWDLSAFGHVEAQGGQHKLQGAALRSTGG